MKRLKRGSWPLAGVAVAMSGLVSGCTVDTLKQGFVSHETTGSVRTVGKEYPTFVAALLAGKAAFHHHDYGLAQTAFQRAAELNANSPDAWLGLAASYDRLRRFDLADRAYGQAAVFLKDNPVYYNNLGYSYLLRGDLLKARENFVRARELNPDNAVVANNIALLRASIGYTQR